MNRSALVLETSAVKLSRFDHPPHAEHSDPEFERSRIDSINIVESGSFSIRLHDRDYVLKKGTVFVAVSGMEFSCTHDTEVPNDSCLSIAFSEHAVEDLRSADVPALRPPFAQVTSRERFLQHRLQSCERGDEVRLDLLAGALFESVATVEGVRVPDTSRVLRGTQADLIRRIERATDLVEMEFTRTLSLDDLARAANLSPFHFARVFRELTGLPPHRYLMAVRLHRAARMIDEGATVSLACSESGFGSLSHFINAFRKRYGIAPSDIKRGRKSQRPGRGWRNGLTTLAEWPKRGMGA